MSAASSKCGASGGEHGPDSTVEGGWLGRLPAIIDIATKQEGNVTMFKVMVMIKRKRKRGMSMADFIDYYETRHAPLGASKVPNLKRYVDRKSVV